MVVRTNIYTNYTLYYYLPVLVMIKVGARDAYASKKSYMTSISGKTPGTDVAVYIRGKCYSCHDD